MVKYSGGYPNGCTPEKYWGHIPPPPEVAICGKQVLYHKLFNNTGVKNTEMDFVSNCL